MDPTSSYSTMTDPNAGSATRDWNSLYAVSTEMTLFTPDTTGSDPVVSNNFSDGCRLLEYLPWSNPDNVIRLQSMLMVFRVLGGALIPLVCLLGAPLNILNCIVFFKQGLKERINLLLFCLALTDFVVDVFLFVSTIEYFYTQLQDQFQINGPLVTFVTNYGSIVYGSVYVSGFITTLISFERCLCITHPFIAKQVLKTKTMGVIVALASVVLTVFIYLVSAQKYRMGCGYYPRLNMKLAVHYPSDFYLENKRLMDIVNGLVYGVALPSFFVLATTVTTTITAVKLRGAATWRQNMSSVTMESKEIALTKMLIAVSCLFIVCTIPNVVLRITPLVVGEFRLGGRNQNLLLSGICVVYMANATNSAMNFIFYYKMGSKYRMVLKSMFTRKQNDLDLQIATVTNSTDIE